MGNKYYNDMRTPNMKLFYALKNCHVQATMLEFVWLNMGQVTITTRELCELFGLKRQNVIVYINELQEKGFLELENKQDLKRTTLSVRKLVLTKEGAGLFR